MLFENSNWELERVDVGYGSFHRERGGGGGGASPLPPLAVERGCGGGGSIGGSDRIKIPDSWGDRPGVARGFQDASGGGPSMPLRESWGGGRGEGGGLAIGWKSVSECFGVRARDVVRIRVAPAIRGLPRNVVRMAEAEGGGDRRWFPEPLACAALQCWQTRRWSDCREGDRGEGGGASAILVPGAAPASRGAGSRGPRDRMACSLNDRGPSEVRRAGLA